MQIEGNNGIFVGGASGMCRATAEKFKARGGNIAILDLEKSNGAEVAQELGAKFYPCNVMDFEAMADVIDAAVSDLGSVQFCVNTAGTGVAQRTVKKDGTRHALKDFQFIIDLNLIGSFNINSIIAEHMQNSDISICLEHSSFQTFINPQEM